MGVSSLWMWTFALETAGIPPPKIRHRAKRYVMMDQRFIIVLDAILRHAESAKSTSERNARNTRPLISRFPSLRHIYDATESCWSLLRPPPTLLIPSYHLPGHETSGGRVLPKIGHVSSSPIWADNRDRRNRATTGAATASEALQKRPSVSTVHTHHRKQWAHTHTRYG